MSNMWKEIKQQPQVFQNALQSNVNTIKQIVEKLQTKNITNVVIAGRGTSDHAGVFAQYMIEYFLGLPVCMAAPSVVTVYRRPLMLKSSLVIAVSQSGMAQDVLEIVKESRRQGGLSISLTNHEDSPLSKEADFFIHLCAGKEESVAATKTFFAQITLLAELVLSWAKAEQYQKEFEEIPNKIQATIQSREVVNAKMQRYRYMNECFVLARGMNYPVAMEAALKLQETCYIKAKAYAISDFYHGPIAMIEKDTPVFLYAPKGECFAEYPAIAEKLNSLGAELIVISDDETMRQYGKCAIAIPSSSHDMLTVFYNTIVAQIIARALADIKARNPDAPRVLRKVTITR